MANSQSSSNVRSSILNTMQPLEAWSPKEIPYNILAEATDNFSEEIVELGKWGGSVPVYRGFLSFLGEDVAVKKLSKSSWQRQSEDYIEEQLGIISVLQHPNLVRLFGWCHESGRDQLLLVYEFMPNGSLDSHLFKDDYKNPLDWSVRQRIAAGLANALMYLHDEGDPPLLHGDVRSSRVFLDSKFDVKVVADFGQARHFNLVNGTSLRPNHAVGESTCGYRAPEQYVSPSYPSRKSEVYSFGVVALEIACGKRANLWEQRENQGRRCGEGGSGRLLVEWVREQHGKNSILDAADKRLKGRFNQMQMKQLLSVGLWCTHPDPRRRPSMGQATNAILSPQTVFVPEFPRDWPSPPSPQRMPLRPLVSPTTTGSSSTSTRGLTESDVIHSTSTTSTTSASRDPTQGDRNHNAMARGTAAALEVEERREQKNDLVKAWSAREISYQVLARATKNFAEEMMLGKGGFGPVYRGFLPDLATDVAIKRLSDGSRQGLSEYEAEVKIITQLRHRNLVKLVGWCHERTGEFLLVYEFMPNGSLHSHLFLKDGTRPLEWSVRCRIVAGLAKALEYLHDQCDPYVLHRDVKSSNILLDSNFVAKLGDFGLARIIKYSDQEDESMLVSRPAGTCGYQPPEYAFVNKASRKGDVYGFGVVALEIACGKKALIPMEGKGSTFSSCGSKPLVAWVRELYGKGSILDAADQRLGGDFDRPQMERLLMVGLWCTQPEPQRRPSMRQAANALLLPETTPLPDLPSTLPACPVSSTVDVVPAHCYTEVYRAPISTAALAKSPSHPTPAMLAKSTSTRTPADRPGKNLKPSSRRFSMFSLFSWKKKGKQKEDGQNDNHRSHLLFNLATLREATNNFSEVIGRGGFGNLYKGLLADGKEVAVRKLSDRCKKMEDCRDQIELLSKLQHKNLHKFLGFSNDGEEKYVVFEYPPNGRLDKLLFDRATARVLDWEERYKIIQGVARGLHYLHEDSGLNVIHRDLNPGCILLDADMNPKISDYGLAPLFDEDLDDDGDNHSRVLAGTTGYIAPEHLISGSITPASDVYSFGVLVLEIVTGKRSNSRGTGLRDFQPNRGDVLKTVDPSLGGQYPETEVRKCINLALRCVREYPRQRPTMSEVVKLLA